MSNENIMADIPILEIDCNMEFHEDSAAKEKMLNQVSFSVTVFVYFSLQSILEILEEFPTWIGNI